MATIEKREKRRANRMRRNSVALAKAQEDANLDTELPEEDEFEILEESLVEKGMDMPMPVMGPTSWEELDSHKAAMEMADHAREVTYNVQDLVSNILYSDMPPKEKASAIKDVGDGFGKRLKMAEQPVEKSVDMDLLEIQALLARDSRHTPVLEKVGDWITKKKFKTPDNIAKIFYIHDKAHVRQALHLAAEMIEKGGDGEAVAKEALPGIKEAAKTLGVGVMNKSSSAVIIEKDSSGSWRAVMWPSNNFIDLDGDIISEKAHSEYVDWVNKNMDVAPVFMIHHIPGTLRKNRVDFVGYENGFLLMSAPLEPNEAAGLLRAQLKTDLGMSHGTFVLERNQTDNRVIEKYRMIEVSDLPLENAANPFTDFETLKKEATMDTKTYLVSVLGSEEEADKYLKKMDLKQKALREAGVEEKAKAETPETHVASTVISFAAPAAAPVVNIDQIVEAVRKDIDVEGLSEMLTKMSEDTEKLAVLEDLIKELKKDKDEELAEKISPPVTKVLAWQKMRKSQSAETVLKEDDPKDEKLKKSQPEAHWLLKAVGADQVEA